MTERAYTVREIDDLRRAVSMFIKTGWINSSPSHKTIIEEYVRTYMIAGRTASDIDEERRKQYQEELEEWTQAQSLKQQSQTPTKTSSISSSGVEPPIPSVVASVDFSAPPTVTNEPGKTGFSSVIGAITTWLKKILFAHRATRR